MSELRERKTEKREYDIVLYGATSYVGEIIAEYFATNYANDATLKWALAGRSKSKLEDVKQKLVKLNPKLNDLECLIADSGDKSALDKITSKSTVILTTVGPYAAYGNTLVESCADNGTGYVDLTGESYWARETIDKFHQKAEKNNALIVHFCGFDSIPSDIGALMLAEHAKGLGAELLSVKSFVTKLKGGVSGGTIGSAIGMIESGKARKSANPHYLCPSPSTCRAKCPGPSDSLFPRYDSEIKAWTAPFFMAPVNTRTARRSSAMLGESAGFSTKYTYDERLKVPSVFMAYLVSFGLTLFMILLVIRPTRFLMKKFVLPAAGQGPTREQRESGYWALDYVGTIKTKEGETKKIYGKSSGRKDPGYGDTATIISECAIYIAKNRDKCAKGGVLTPAVAFGPKILERLNVHGIQFRIVDKL